MARRKISEPITTLGDGVDLDNITATGVYHQQFSSNASLALNYPAGHAGLLEVHTPPVGAMSYQRYTAYKDFGVYTRSHYGYEDAWSPWQRILTE